ncbi:SIS domain-containing protein [Brevundimonas sp. SGAir0440]|uniref:D-sedoheptulose-7-phosphate isomerase n=1 Tax=Brevundimonas sp. SGAir0440 TaxID=2579977 RepID=UPI0010CD0A09|nr:SIS domain-containing protein [Brevundimonas sp. SGAir0440]QCQ97585.1 SIS domain-containing protein [Brevundimonas sp. SGAir0440]
MSFFPNRPYRDCTEFADAYFEQLCLAFQTVLPAALSDAAALIENVVHKDGNLFSCGNGGSAAIANHLLCDWLKGAAVGSAVRPRVHTLSSASELITALANDVGVEEIFAHPLRSLARTGDLLIAISSSGASANIVRAIETAQATGMSVIALTGFDGGPAARLADVSLHVSSYNYGVVEDVHQSLMHILAQYLRQSNLQHPDTLGKITF